MSRAQERLAEREYHQALTFLHEALQREEDSFLDETPAAVRTQGVKAAIRKLIGELPPDGRDAYELLFGAAARRDLDTAVAAGDRQQIAQVVRRYYHTSAGYEAALILALLEADEGHYAAATHLLQELLEAPRAASALEPQLSFLAATNHWAAGQSDLAVERLQKLIEVRPNSALELGGRRVALPGAGASFEGWLEEYVGRPARTELVERDWPVLHGTPARAASPPGGPPHLRARWQARVVNDPHVEKFIADRARHFTQRGIVAMPAARPIAVKDVVLMRTPNNVVAVDWRTGKRIWETREEDDAEPLQLAAGLRVALAEGLDVPSTNDSLERRLFDDALAMSLASDGERVFVIRGGAISPEEAALAAQLPFVGGPAGAALPPTNELASFELATEGKLTWVIDGARGGPLNGAFFLGAPLAVDDTLFVLAEIRSAIFLLALDPRDGRPLWQQQLLGLEQGIALDARRRQAGSSPSYAGGLLICPTSAGAVVAVDTVRQEFAWVYQYGREAATPAELRILLQQQIQNQSARTNGQWLDHAVIIEGGRVFITPADSRELHCLDLTTGELIWKQRQADAAFVGAVDRERLLLVGSRTVLALRAADGAAAWSAPIALPADALPAGQGYLSQGQYFLPLTSGAVATIDMAEGKLLSLAVCEEGVPLGHLICCRGSVFSQSLLVLDKFEQFDALERRVEAALARDASDVAAMRDLAELQNESGRPAEAIALLKRAHRLAPDDAQVREMLVEYLLSGLREDYDSFSGEVELLRGLIAGPRQEFELLQAEARAWEARGNRLEAWTAYLRSADLGAAEIPVNISREHSVRSDRWLASRLAALWEAASGEERQTMARHIQSQRAALGSEPDVTRLQRFLTHFGQLPDTQDDRLQLIQLLIARRQFRAAELQLLPLIAAPEAKGDKKVIAAAAQFASSLVNVGRYAEAAVYAQWLSAIAADQEVQDGKAPAQMFEQWRQKAPGFVRHFGLNWPRGRVVVETVEKAADDDPWGELNAGREVTGRQPTHRRLRVEMQYGDLPAAAQWLIAADGSYLLSRSRFGEDVARVSLVPNSEGRPVSDPRFASAALLGPLTIVSRGGQITAIESTEAAPGGAGEVLWQSLPSDRVADRPPIAPGGTMRGRNLYHGWSDRKREIDAATGAIIGSLGPVTPFGIVFYDRDELRCVDPLSGEMLWARRDLPSGCELFGDDELVFVADAAEMVAHILLLSDGSTAGKRPLPGSSWMLTAGRNLAHQGSRSNGGTPRSFLSVVDMASGDVLFDADYGVTTRMTVVGPDRVAVYDPDGKFQLVDVGTGKLLIDQSVQSSAAPQSLYTMIDDDCLFVIISTAARQRQRRALSSDDFPLVNGLVYAFGVRTGKALWPAPAVIRERGFALSAPSDAPFLVFVDRGATDGSENAATLRILCIDKLTGERVYQGEELPDTAAAAFRMRVVPLDHPLSAAEPSGGLAIDMSAQRVRLTPSAQARPPEPPLDDDLASARSSGERGLYGLFEQAGDARGGSRSDGRANRGGRGGGRGGRQGGGGIERDRGG
jgi:outer membrane protein assembly factor BamB